jgi:hypothetical protein
MIMASKEANEHAHSVLLLFSEGIQKAVSVGFRPRDIRREVRDDRDIVVLSDNLLIEVSATPVGSNPDALADQKAAELEYIRQHLGVAIIGRAVVPYQGYPVITGTWDSKAAEKRIRAWAGGEDNISWPKYRRAFTWYDSSKPEIFDSYKLPHHDVMDGELRTHRSGVIAAGNAVQGARGGVNIPDSDKAGVRSHLGRHYKQFDMQPPWERSEPYELQKDSPSPVRGDDNNQGADSMSEKTLEETKAALKTAEAEVARLGTENSAYKSQNEQLAKERDDANARADKAEKEISDAKKAKEEAEIEAEVDKEVSVRITPAEKESFLELRRTNEKLYKSMLEQRRPMTHQERTAGNDADPDTGNSHKAAGDSSEASDALDAEAGC